MHAKTEAARLDRVRPSHPGSQDATEGSRRRGYSFVNYRFDRKLALNALSSRDQWFETPGDTIHVLELNGAAQIGISTAGGKFIPVREGDVITREFAKFAVRFLGDRHTDNAVTYGQNYGTCEALLLVSYGETIKREPKRNGFMPGFPARRIASSTVGVDVLAAFAQAAAVVTNGAHLKGGGTLIIKNLDPVASVFVYHGPPGLFDASGVGSLTVDSAFELYAGESLTLDCESRMLQAQTSNASDSAGRFSSICVASLAGTPIVNALISRWNPDTSEAESASQVGEPNAGIQ